MSSLYIHIGVPKTGTTFLQKNIFPNLVGLKYFSKKEMDKFIDGRTFSDFFRYSPSLWRNNNRAQELISWIAETASGHPALISEECIHGGQFPPESSRPFNDDKVEKARWEGYDVSTLARHVHEISRRLVKYGYSSVKIIATIRRQDTKLASSYAEISSSIRNASQEDFESWTRNLLSGSHLYYRAGAAKLNYNWLYDCLVDQMGKNSVFLFPYEVLGSNPIEYVDAWCKVLNVRLEKGVRHKKQKRLNKKSTGKNTWSISPPLYLGPRIRPRSLALDRLGVPNRLLGSWFDWSREDSIVLTEELSEFIMSQYAVFNEELNNKISAFNLEEFGYC